MRRSDQASYIQDVQKAMLGKAAEAESLGALRTDPESLLAIIREAEWCLRHYDIEVE